MPNKDVVELPDGTFAEKFVLINADGTGIGGASNTATGVQEITNSVNKLYVLLPNGKYAERKIAVNPDGTAVGA
jgi:hypothetical protein